MTIPTHLLSLDQGTTSSRATLFTDQGEAVASSSCGFAQHYPRPGWVEHDPMEIWESQLSCLNETIAAGGVPAADIAGIEE